VFVGVGGGVGGGKGGGGGGGWGGLVIVIGFFRVCMCDRSGVLGSGTRLVTHNLHTLYDDKLTQLGSCS